VHLTRLSLTNFRNYERQTLEFERGTVLLLGENAQGKTNVLEAIALLATGRSERASGDGDYIRWAQRDETQPFARIEGSASRASGDVTVDLTIAGRTGARGNLVGTKRFKLNGVARRGSDVLGAILAVMFTTDDMELVKGAPAGRRRLLDVMLTQADRRYARALSKYNKLVTQRNALLKRIGEGSAKRDELAYWDEELSREGATLVTTRAGALAQVSPHAAEAHARLSGEREELGVAYEPRFTEAWNADRIVSATEDEIGEAFLERLRATHPRDIGAGLTLSGPHRDDVTVTLGGEAAASFASRGQQRTAALALRLAEARFLRDTAGEQPILLLDDVLSELDEHRRASVLAAIEADQIFVTSPDADRFPAAFRKKAQVFSVISGQVAQFSGR
jgi:DNA replication and repair protein RecF